jgi:protein-(glutamine-N5) methyltransferase, release factor-specific
MTGSEAAGELQNALQDLYSQRELKSISQILLEDLFGIKGLSSSKEVHDTSLLHDAISRLIDKEPIQYITGRADFYGLALKVNENVLIPRPETEELVHWMVTDIKGEPSQKDILDIGTGSGCIPLAIKSKCRASRLFAIDRDMDVLNVARINSRKLRLPCTFFNFDFLDERLWTEMGLFDIIVSNPPYIPLTERDIMDDNVVLYEPFEALFLEGDPLIFYKSIYKFAVHHLRPGGDIYLEVHERFAASTMDIFRERYSNVELRQDLQGKDRMIKISDRK